MRHLLSLPAFLLASSVAFAAPAHKAPAGQQSAASFASHQTVTEKEADGVYDLSGLPHFSGQVIAVSALLPRQRHGLHPA
ncbi:hypothetical protein Amal_01486 [Acetobacter malorum]|uniref:Uncharacterized protein n=1 Tax=Acetobacter malorum TaxID=178901 RepID=A0A177GBQ5_9PROT|nr:hypothetical protein [Acetobacter malorum]OAG77236.1 hypothetical protein Amal_01486 [Acetobacter malorum]